MTKRLAELEYHWGKFKEDAKDSISNDEFINLGKYLSEEDIDTLSSILHNLNQIEL